MRVCANKLIWNTTAVSILTPSGYWTPTTPSTSPSSIQVPCTTAPFNSHTKNRTKRRLPMEIDRHQLLWRPEREGGKEIIMHLDRFVLHLQTLLKPTISFVSESPYEQYNFEVRGACVGQPYWGSDPSHCTHSVVESEDEDWLLLHTAEAVQLHNLPNANWSLNLSYGMIKPHIEYQQLFSHFITGP